MFVWKIKPEKFPFSLGITPKSCILEGTDAHALPPGARCYPPTCPSFPDGQGAARGSRGGAALPRLRATGNLTLRNQEAGAAPYQSGPAPSWDNPDAPALVRGLFCAPPLAVGRQTRVPILPPPSPASHGASGLSSENRGQRISAAHKAAGKSQRHRRAGSCLDAKRMRFLRSL